MKEIEVCAAVIIKNKKILLTQRGYGEYKDKREFPGGKIEKDESKEEAIKREIREELDASIKVDNFLCKVEYDYTTFYLMMNVFCVSLEDEHIKAATEGKNIVKVIVIKGRLVNTVVK